MVPQILTNKTSQFLNSEFFLLNGFTLPRLENTVYTKIYPQLEKKKKKKKSFMPFSKRKDFAFRADQIPGPCQGTEKKTKQKKPAKNNNKKPQLAQP